MLSRWRDLSQILYWQVYWQVSFSSHLVGAGGVWPGLGFLALLQISAVVLNLIPVPPFDGYGVVAPFLNPELRMKISKAGIFITLGMFFLLWYVPFVNNIFWDIVGYLGNLLRLPYDLVIQGYSEFRFWKR